MVRKTKARKNQSTEMLSNVLVPEHKKLSDKDKQALFKNYNVTLAELPKIFADDPALRHLDVNEGDVIRITRFSESGAESVYYRGVINA